MYVSMYKGSIHDWGWWFELQYDEAIMMVVTQRNYIRGLWALHSGHEYRSTSATIAGASKR